MSEQKGGLIEPIGEFYKNSVSHFLDGLGHERCQFLAVGEHGSFNAIDNQFTGKPAQGAGEFHGFGEAEKMAGVSKCPTGQFRLSRIISMHGSGDLTGTNRIHQNNPINALP